MNKDLKYAEELINYLMNVVEELSPEVYYKSGKITECDDFLKKINGEQGLNTCINCGKTKKEHFHKYKKEYDIGLRDRYYCKKYGIVEFEVKE